MPFDYMAFPHFSNAISILIKTSKDEPKELKESKRRIFAELDQMFYAYPGLFDAVDSISVSSSSPMDIECDVIKNDTCHAVIDLDPYGKSEENFLQEDNTSVFLYMAVGASLLRDMRLDLSPEFGMHWLFDKNQVKDN